MNKEISTFHIGRFIFDAGSGANRSKLAEAEGILFLSGKLPVFPNEAESTLINLEKRSLYAASELAGNTLNLSETESIVNGDESLFGEDSRAVRLFNLGRAYAALAVQKKDDSFRIDEKFITEFNTVLERKLNSEPANYRNFPVSAFEKQFSKPYSPPETKLDINLLMKTFYEWINSPEIISSGVITRASLAHLYLMRIYPYAGSSETLARLAESYVYKTAGVGYMPYLLCTVYRNSSDYFPILERFIESNNPAEFIDFVCGIVISSLGEMQKKSLEIIAEEMFDSYVRRLLEAKVISERLCGLINILKTRDSFRHSELQLMKEFTALYGKVSRTTVRRDIVKLAELGLIKERGEEEYILNRDILFGR